MNGQLPDGYFYKRALMLDNPSLPPEYLAAMDSLDELTRAVFVNGDWDVSDVERPFAYAFNKFKTVKTGVAIHPNEPIILSFDFNVDPITCIAGQSYGDKIRIIREFRLKNSDIFRLCESIRVEFGDRLFIVTGDASGANRSAMTRGAVNYYTIIRDELQLPKSAFKVPSVNPSIKNSRVLLNSILEKHPDIQIDAGCQWLIHDLQNVETTSNGDIEKTKDSNLSHLLDCFRYYLWTFHNDFVKYRN
jgi:phage terminase large subunit